MSIPNNLNRTEIENFKTIFDKMMKEMEDTKKKDVNFLLSNIKLISNANSNVINQNLVNTPGIASRNSFSE